MGGVLRGTIVARVASNGRVKGKLEFSAHDGDDDSSWRPARGGSGSDGGSGDDVDADGDGGEDDGKEFRLAFDPRGQLIEIKSSAGTFFSHVFGDGSAADTGGGVATVPGEINVALFSSGADADATAKADWNRDDRGGESFEVEIEDVIVGRYELFVGGIVRGTTNVISTERGTRGKLEFDDEPAGAEQSLSFDPLNQVVTIRRDGTVYFERAFPAGS